MSSMTVLSLGRMTRAEFDARPEWSGGPRHELIEGELFEMDAPRPRHQDVIAELYVLLRAACPGHRRVYFAPIDVDLEESSVPQPDLVVVDKGQIGERLIEGNPLLVVEVLSPTNRRHDMERKRRLYERVGIENYWIVDPEGTVTLTAWALRDGHYVEVVSVSGDDSWTAGEPFAVTVVPSALVI